MPEKKVRKPRRKTTIKKTGQKQKQTVKVVVNVAGGKDSEKQAPRYTGPQTVMYNPPIFTRENAIGGFREPETTAPVYKMPSKPKSTAMPFTTPVPANPNFSPEESSVSRQERIVDAITDDPIDINAGLPEDKYAKINTTVKGLFSEFKAQNQPAFLPFKAPEPARDIGSEFISQPADTGIATMNIRTPRTISPEKLEAYKAYDQMMRNRRGPPLVRDKKGFIKPKTL